MGAAGDAAVKRRGRKGRTVLVIDFTYTSDGRKQRYCRDAQIQQLAAARAEADERVTRAHRLGDPRLAHEIETEKPAEKPKLPTLKEFFEGIFTASFLPRFSPATRDRYLGVARQGLLELFGHLRLDEIDAMTDRAFDTWLRTKGLQARGPRGLLRTLTRCAFEAGLLPEQPRLAPLPAQSRKLPSAPVHADVDALLKHATGWLRVAVALAAYAGLRSGEIRALEVRDVDFQRGVITVRHALSGEAAEVCTPKSGHERGIPISELLVSILAEACKSKLPKARVVTRAGETPRRQAILHALTKLQREHGLKPWTVHSLRHFFCSALVRGGASLEAVRVLAGHSKLDVTQRYLHVADGDLATAIRKL
jgi:integrase